MSFGPCILYLLSTGNYYQYWHCQINKPITLNSLFYRKYKFHRKCKHVLEADQLPGVSIIKPLMGVDDNLKDNLETFFNMDYPLYELLFCVQDVNDPVINLVKSLIDQYPSVDAKLFCGKFPSILSTDNFKLPINQP